MKLELILALSALIVLAQGLNISPHIEESEDDSQGLQSVSPQVLPAFDGGDYSLIESGLAEPSPYAPRRKDSEATPKHPGLLLPPVGPTRPPSKCCWIWSCEPPMDSKSNPQSLISCLTN